VIDILAKNYYKTTRLVVLCPGLPESAGIRKVKPIWIYWSKRHWVALASAGHMQIYTSPRQMTMPPPTTHFFTGQMPFLPPNQQLQSTECNKLCCKW